MARSTQQSGGLLRQAVHYHLDNLSYQNAIFYAERLCAQDMSPDSVYLLSLCHLRLGDHQSAYEASKAPGYKGGHVGCVYVFAQACLKLEQWREGIVALEKSRNLWQNRSNMGKHSDQSRAPHADAAACSCLLGKLYRKQGDKKKAMTCFEDALKANPLMWDAFTALCDMGIAVNVPNIFRPCETLVKSFQESPKAGTVESGDSQSQSEPLLQRHRSRQATYDNPGPFDRQPSAAANSMFSIHSSSSTEGSLISKIVAAKARNANDSTSLRHPTGPETPTKLGSIHDLRQARRDQEEALAAGVPNRRPYAVHNSDTTSEDSMVRQVFPPGARRREKPPDAVVGPIEPTLRPAKISIPAGDRKRTASGLPAQSKQLAPEDPGQRRSARLNTFKQTISKALPGTDHPTRELKRAKAPISRLMRAGPGGVTVGRAVSGNRARTDEPRMEIDQTDDVGAKENPIVQRLPSRQSVLEPSRIEDSLRVVLDLLCKIATGYQQLAQYECQNAVATFLSLPRAQQDTPWVQSQLGRAHYEQAAYAEAEKHYLRLRYLEPARQQDMELYSTVLWHLRSEINLSFLAHQLIDATWHSPQAWCALGNAWSLVSDHEQALRCFKRATQLAPDFAYAFTLQGHEHVANEEYDKALTAYRQAVGVDRRHYNGYYGIGRVYEKLGSYDKAQAHYQMASTINPSNAVLVCCIGTVLEKQGRVDLALEYFEKATKLAPKAAQTRFRKARTLLAKGFLREAQAELVIIKDLAPDDARVHFLLGKLYKTSNDKGQAIRHFTQALSLDPKASQLIKTAIESIEDEDILDNSLLDP